MKFVKLKEICKLKNGYAFKSKDFVEDGISLIRIGEISNGKIDLKNSKKIRKSELYKRYEVHSGDILIAMSGATTGKTGKYQHDSFAYLNQRVGCFIPETDKLNNEYLNHFLKTRKKIILHKAYGGGQPNISPTEIGNLKILLPSLDDQIRIAKVLTQAENLIAKRKESIKALDEFLKSTFLEMFGDSVRNEKGWEKKALNQFGQIITGNTPPRNDEINYSSNFIEWIKTDNIVDDKMFLTTATEYLSETGLSRARFVTNGALLVACIAGSIKSIGRIAIANRNVSFNQQINAIQPNKNVNTFFLYWLFIISKPYIQDHATKGMKKILTKGSFEKIITIFPPIERQDKFASIVKKTEQTKQKMQESLNEMENNFNALMQEYFG